MKTILLSISVLALASGSIANAASINFDTGSARGHMFTTSDTTTRLPIGSIVRLGTMSSGNPTSFTEFATTTINNTGGASTIVGFLRDGVTISTPAQADAIKGQQIYLWVYNTTSMGSINSPTVASGLFTSQEWTLPAGFDSAGTTTFNIRLGGNSNGTPATPAVVASASPSFGTYTAGPISIANIVNTNGGIYALNAAIPEPSSVGLIALLGMAALRRRR